MKYKNGSLCFCVDCFLMNLDILKSEPAEWNTIWLWSCYPLASTIHFLTHPNYLSPQWSGFWRARQIVQHHKKAFIHIQSHARPLWKHKWLWFVLACNTAISEETRARLVRVCNYCFCLLLRTAPNYPPQTWKFPNYRRKAEESKTWNISREVCNNCFQVHFMLTSC